MQKKKKNPIGLLFDYTMLLAGIGLVIYLWLPIIIWLFIK